MASDSALAADSASSRVHDTVKVTNNQTCYWTRDFWGRPELRCYDSYYGRDWYRYNYYPWWNRSSSYYYGDYNNYGWNEQCPAYYYYDYSCGACRYYRSYRGNQRSWWWDSPGYSGSTSSSASSRPSHSRSVIDPGEVPITPSSSLEKSGFVPSGVPQTGTSESSGSGIITQPRHGSRSSGVSDPGEVRIVPNTQTPDFNELPKLQTQQEQEQQQNQMQRMQVAPQPPAARPEPTPSASPQQNTNQNTNSGGQPREHRNLRSVE
jgi:hypothetical protein